MSNTFATLINSIGWALIDFLWQGVFIGFIAWIGLSIARNAKAETRYAILCLAIFACYLIPVASVVLDLISGIEAPTVNMQAFFVPKDSAQWMPSLGLVEWLQRHLTVVVICWFFVTSILSIRFCLGLWWLYVTSGATRNSNNEYWQQKIETMANSVGIRARVVLRVVRDLDSPITLGSLRPVILVPAALVIGMDARYLEALLAHEIAHIRRHDYVLNLLQNIIEIFLFYHPAVWWISKQIRNERENIADDLAASMLGEPRRLALALQELELIQFSLTQPALGAHGGYLMSRIKRLVRPEAQAVNWKTAAVLTTVAATFVATFAQAAAPVAVEMVANTLQPVRSAEKNTRNSFATSSIARQLFQARSTAPDQNTGASTETMSNHVLTDGAVNNHFNASSENVSSDVSAGKSDTPAMKEVFERTAYGTTQKVRSDGVDFTNPACVPLYPRKALREHVTGTTTLKVTTDSDGQISNAEVAESSGSDSLDNALIKSLTSNDCKTSLGSQGGVRAMAIFPVSYTWKIDHQF